MSGRGGNKYKSMGASYREGQEDGGGRGRGRGRVNKYRRQLNGNYMKQGNQAAGGEDTNAKVPCYSMQTGLVNLYA